MKPLTILWQRLVDARGRTCERCGATQAELERAVATLGKILGPLGIEPVLETKEIGPDAFEADPSQSNRIWIGGRALEDWLGARVASSPCCSVCGDSECRTLELGDDAFETIPQELVLRAGLVAAAELVGSGAREIAEKCNPGCCSG
jgi:hypothetical protein